MELEEAIKILKYCDVVEIMPNRDDINYYEYQEAIETVLQNREKLEAEVKNLKEIEEEHKEANGKLNERINKLEKKIEDKIAYWNKRLDKDEGLDWIIKDKCIINVLQELLEDK